jgi:hypothetical protein
MEYIFIIALGWLITEFEPLHFVLDAVKDKLPKSSFIDYLHGAFSCWQCTTFWTGLAMSGNVFIAATCSLVTHLVSVWIAKK